MSGQFRKLSPNEKKGILEEAHLRGVTVMFKFIDSGVLKMKVLEKGWGESVIGKRPATLGEGRRGESVTANFQVDGEFYFFNAVVRIQRTLVALEVEGGVHRLIRRRNSRLQIPSNLAMSVSTKRIGNRISFLRGLVQDLSAKGVRVAFHEAEAVPKKDETVAGTIRFGVRQAIEFTGTVRHSRQVSKSHFDHLVGIEFTELSDAERFQSWLVSIHRELFSKR